jgi:hypothetical protein
VNIDLCTNRNSSIHDGIKIALNSGEVWYHSENLVIFPWPITRRLKIYSYKLMSCFIWVWNSVSQFKRRTQLRMFENRILWEIVGQRDSWSNVGLENLHNLYSLPNMVNIIISWRMACARHTTRLEEC